ncbi:hypothetical protein V495_01095 [Pseudogymnoascus sp. VKM F-4514 (FW-929)]|nr:hypothetical protein V495_01095 [Pseudogymnoascus sp. VKM F-4514 (FW-929)]KFY64009.1 hypothetical protein V497_01863 [Pseudogymnoascus sp. VKM F-4516 (FW-969)]
MTDRMRQAERNTTHNTSSLRRVSMQLTVTFASSITDEQVTWVEESLAEAGVPAEEKSRTETSVTFIDPSTVTYQIAGDLCRKWLNENLIYGFSVIADSPLS